MSTIKDLVKQTVDEIFKANTELLNNNYGIVKSYLNSIKTLLIKIAKKTNE